MPRRKKHAVVLVDPAAAGSMAAWLVLLTINSARFKFLLFCTFLLSFGSLSLNGGQWRLSFVCHSPAHSADGILARRQHENGLLFYGVFGGFSFRVAAAAAIEIAKLCYEYQLKIVWRAPKKK